MNETNPLQKDFRRILIVEDEKNQRIMLSRAIRECDYHAVTASNGTEAIKLLEQDNQACIAILDLNLPDMTGLELAHQIHQRWPEIQFIVLTGYGTLEAAQQAIRLDVVDFLLKPTTLGELESAIARAWQKFLHGKALPMLQEQETPSNQLTTNNSLSIADAERQLIDAALARHDDNRTAAAQDLGISVRTLYYRLERYELEDKVANENKQQRSK